jgi:hypothetical protein
MARQEAIEEIYLRLFDRVGRFRALCADSCALINLEAIGAFPAFRAWARPVVALRAKDEIGPLADRLEALCRESGLPGPLYVEAPGPFECHDPEAKRRPHRPPSVDEEVSSLAKDRGLVLLSDDLGLLSLSEDSGLECLTSALCLVALYREGILDRTRFDRHRGLLASRLAYPEALRALETGLMSLAEKGM